MGAVNVSERLARFVAEAIERAVRLAERLEEMPEVGGLTETLRAPAAEEAHP